MRSKEEIITDIQKVHHEFELTEIYNKIADELKKKRESYSRKNHELEARLKNPKLSEDQQNALSKQIITVVRSEIAYSQVEKMVLSHVRSIMDPDSEFSKNLRELVKEINTAVEDGNVFTDAEKKVIINYLAAHKA
jgi:Mg2+ and Co2+ transporter CorA